MSMPTNEEKENASAKKGTSRSQTDQGIVTFLRTPLGTEGITGLSIKNFKSICNQQSIEIRPLTILAGANSTGKSSIMQPLLLLKQTLEANYDPGALLLNGPNIRFTSTDQLLSYTEGTKRADTFSINITIDKDIAVTILFKKSETKGFEIEQMMYDVDHNQYSLHVGMSSDEILQTLPPYFRGALSDLRDILPELRLPLEEEQREQQRSSSSNASSKGHLLEFEIIPVRCFLAIGFTLGNTFIPTPFFLDRSAASLIRQIIHLPGLRGNPERTYPVTTTATDFSFVGTFDNYFASVIGNWQNERNQKKLDMLNNDLIKLGLTSNVIAEQINSTELELRVSRFIHREPNVQQEMVSIADVGLGISQTLPVLVALHVAKEGQLLYLEQPEIHLHPRAQFKMAEVLAEAAQRGCHLVVETHSSLLLQGIQTLVAEKQVSPDIIKLHWFDRLEDGSTRVTSADLDENGAFGDWPEDFAEVSLEGESRYLDAQS